MEFRALSSAILALAITAVSCGPALNSDPMLSSLVNKGVLQVESDNPYLAINKFLRSEAEKSKELAGFLALKGQPRAVELQQGSFSSLTMTFHYPSDRYELEESGDGWIITGPFAERGSPVSAAAAQQPTVAPTAPPTRRPTPRVAATPALPGPTTTPLPVGMFLSPESKESAPPQPTIPVNSDAMASAEVSPRGDIVHYVTYPGETLSIIARWYTEDRSNAPKLGRLNQLKSDNQLEIGDQIIIPSYMIKNKARLTEDGVQRLKDAAAQNSHRREP